MIDVSIMTARDNIEVLIYRRYHNHCRFGDGMPVEPLSQALPPFLGKGAVAVKNGRG